MKLKDRKELKWRVAVFQSDTNLGLKNRQRGMHIVRTVYAEWEVTGDYIKGLAIKWMWHVTVGEVGMSDRGLVISSAG